MPSAKSDTARPHRDPLPAAQLGDCMPLREFGRRVDKTGEAVRQAIADGRIPGSCWGLRLLDGGGTRPVITDAAAAAAAWAAARDPRQVRDKATMAAGGRRGWKARKGDLSDGPAPAGKATSAKRKPAAAAGPAAAPPVSPPPAAKPAPRSLSLDVDPDEDDEPAEGAIDPATGLPTAATSRARTEYWKAKSAELEYRQKAGLLVDAESVKSLYLKQVTAARNAFRGLGAKVKGKIPRLSVAEVGSINDLVDKMLGKLADGKALEDAGADG